MIPTLYSPVGLLLVLSCYDIALKKVQKGSHSGRCMISVCWGIAHREFAARVGADAHKAQADLQAAQQQKGKMVITNTKLSQASS